METKVTKRELLDELLDVASIKHYKGRRESSTLDKEETRELLSAVKVLTHQKIHLIKASSEDRAVFSSLSRGKEEKIKRLIVGLSVSNVFWIFVTIALTYHNG